MSAKKKLSSGRPVSGARKYFALINEDDMKCQLKRIDGTDCNHIVKNGFRFGGNLKYHLANNHKDIAKLLEEEEEKSRRSDPGATCSKSALQDQPRINSIFNSKEKFGTDSIEYKRITEALALHHIVT